MCSCRLFELYGNETKMKLLAKELAPLQNISSQNCITLSVDGSKFATGGSVSIALKSIRLNCVSLLCGISSVRF
ncbi:hypothetical protein HN51_040346 [Arachis hypogaea]